MVEKTGSEPARKRRKVRLVISIAGGILPWVFVLLLPHEDLVYDRYYLFILFPVIGTLYANALFLRDSWKVRKCKYLSIVSSLSCLLYVLYSVLLFVGDMSLHPT